MVILFLQMYFRYENARRDRVYGKHVPNTRVDTSELADRVSAITFLEYHDNSNLHGSPNFDRHLASATLRDLVRAQAKAARPRPGDVRAS
jgi:hypothetical protein